VSIEWLRDLAICVLGFGAAVVVIFLGILAFLLYRKVSPILDSVKGTTRTVRNISSCVEEEVARPLTQIAAFVQGVSQAVGLVRQFTQRRTGGKNE